MHVVFLHTALPGVRFNSSVAALSAWLKAAGHSTGLLTVPDDADPNDAVLALRGVGADALALSFMTCCAPAVARLVPALRAICPGTPLIAGGAHPTLYPAEVLALGVDAVCIGEGEAPLLAFLEGRDHPGLLRRPDAPVTRWWAPDADALPDWDRALFGDVYNEGNRYEVAVGVALSRGFCPFQCTFCGVDGYRRANQPPAGAVQRLRTVPRVLAEVERARQEVPVRQGFAAWDEILPLNRQWVAAFLAAWGEQVSLPLAVQLRVEQVTPALAAQLSAAGCDYAVIGVECGDDAYRKKMLRKPFTSEDAILAFRLLHDAGIQTFGSFLIGLPFETPAQLAATVRLARQIAPSELSWKYYTPERGTQLHALCAQHGLLIDRYVDHPFGGDEPMIRLTRCSPRDVDRAREALTLLAGGARPGTFDVRGPAAAPLACRT